MALLNKETRIKNLIKEIKESKEIGNLKGLLGKDLGEKLYTLLDLIEEDI